MQNQQPIPVRHHTMLFCGYLQKTKLSQMSNCQVNARPTVFSNSAPTLNDEGRPKVQVLNHLVFQTFMYERDGGVNAMTQKLKLQISPAFFGQGQLSSYFIGFDAFNVMFDLVDLFYALSLALSCCIHVVGHSFRYRKGKTNLPSTLKYVETTLR